MNKTIIGLIVVIIALGVAIYFFQGKIIRVIPSETTVQETTVPKPDTNAIPDYLPPSMEDGTIEPDTSSSSDMY